MGTDPEPDRLRDRPRLIFKNAEPLGGRMEEHMGRIYGDIGELVGGTPLLELKRVEEAYGLEARLLAKLESFNPGGSVKDRVARAMLDDAEARGLLGPGSVIIEPTSGNTGVGLACIAASRGYRVIIVMPDSMSRERQLLLAAYGAELVLTEGAKGMRGAIERAQALSRELPGSFVAGQFVNPANPAAHMGTTGPEIWEDTDGEVDVFVAGVGTGGTITGVGRYLKGKNPSVRLVAVEPARSPVLSGGKAGSHGLQGIGAGFVPQVLERELCDEIFPVEEAPAMEMSRLLARREGVLAGISSGAALYAAVEVARRPENRGRTVVVLLPDTGERYLSTELFSPQPRA